ncbi:unnamed protein product [Sphagnum tenellum]
MSFHQDVVFFDERGGRHVDQNCRSYASPLRATHGNSFVPGRGAFPKLNPFGGILNSLLPKVVLLNEENLTGGGKRG